MGRNAGIESYIQTNNYDNLGLLQQNSNVRTEQLDFLS